MLKVSFFKEVEKKSMNFRICLLKWKKKIEEVGGDYLKFFSVKQIKSTKPFFSPSITICVCLLKDV